MTREEWKQWFSDNAEWFSNNCYNYYRIEEKFSKMGTISIKHGCSKICIVDTNAGFVLKWCMNNHYNEMQREYEFYNLAVDRNIQCFFPCTERFLSVGDVDIFLQSTVETIFHEMHYKDRKALESHHSTVKDEIVRKARQGFYSAPPQLWIKLAISIYGKHRVKELCKFTKDYKINDLHEGNVGMNKNFPIILDFSGYHQDSYTRETQTNSSY